eukprot:11124476-Prorocentrum_lima.AAC.1
MSNQYGSRVEDVEFVSDRLIRLTLRSIVPTTIICAHVPAAARAETEKYLFYERLETLYRPW